MCGEMVQMYAGLRDEELRGCRGKICERVRASSESLRKWLRWWQGCAMPESRLWAVSSTNRWVIAEGVRDFGIPQERILAAEVRVVDGIITSELVDVPTDEAKATALKRVGLPAPDAVFGNSIHDLAMLEMARARFR